MSALLESLLDATRRADCAANDLAIGCSRASTPLQTQIRPSLSTLVISAVNDEGQADPANACEGAQVVSEPLPAKRRAGH